MSEVGENETQGRHYYSVQIKQRSFSHIVLRLDVNLGQTQLDIFREERKHCCGGRRDAAAPFDPDVTQLRSSLFSSNLRIRCVQFSMLGRL